MAFILIIHGRYYDIPLFSSEGQHARDTGLQVVAAHVSIVQVNYNQLKVHLY